MVHRKRQTHLYRSSMRTLTGVNLHGASKLYANPHNSPAARCSDLRTVSRPRVDLHLFRVLISDLYKWVCLFIVHQLVQFLLLLNKAGSNSGVVIKLMSTLWRLGWYVSWFDSISTVVNTGLSEIFNSLPLALFNNNKNCTRWCTEKDNLIYTDPRWGHSQVKIYTGPRNCTQILTTRLRLVVRICVQFLDPV